MKNGIVISTSSNKIIELDSDSDVDEYLQEEKRGYEIILPLPTLSRYPRQYTTNTLSTTTTPLIQPKKNDTRSTSHPNDNFDRYSHRDERDLLSPSRLLGDSMFVSSRRNESFQSISTPSSTFTTSNSMRPNGGMTGWFFGFMYEEVSDETFDFDYRDDEDANVNTSVWNSLNLLLFASYTFTTAATALPVLLIPVIGHDFLSDEREKSSFSSLAASSAVLGIACGKIVNAQVGDFYGARRTSSLYSILLALALLSLSTSQDSTSATTACFFVEFFQSVQWPCIIVILGAHYRPPNQTQYESGIFLTSIASRFGALVGIPIFSLLLRQLSWRIVCLIGAWIASIGASIMYLYVMDSPQRTNDPQNPLHPKLMQQVETLHACTCPKRFVVVCIIAFRSIISNNLLPSFRHVLTSGTFWVVAIAHTGSTMVKSAERIIGTYFYDTSFGYLSESDAGDLTVYLSMGILLGLGIAGRVFTQRKERQRKLLVLRLYIITIVACYSLAVLAIPRLRHLVNSPDLILFFQVASSLCMGFGISVMYSLVPGLVGMAFGPHSGSYMAYTDGVAFGLSSIVWKIVANAVANGNPEGGGWAYGWAAVALLIVLCAILMTEFMEHYFVRTAEGRHCRKYETIILA